MANDDLTKRPRKIHGREFLAWLKSFGIIPERASYVNIKASCDSPVEITVELYGTEEMVASPPPPEVMEAEVNIIDEFTGGSC